MTRAARLPSMPGGVFRFLARNTCIAAFIALENFGRDFFWRRFPWGSLRCPKHPVLSPARQEAGPRFLEVANHA